MTFCFFHLAGVTVVMRKKYLHLLKLFSTFFTAKGAVAQLGERMTGSHEVVGSNPISSTKLGRSTCALFCWFRPVLNRTLSASNRFAKAGCVKRPVLMQTHIIINESNVQPESTGPMVTTIFFDLGNVLVNVDTDTLVRRFAAVLPDIQHLANDTILEEIPEIRRFELGEIDRYQFYDSIAGRAAGEISFSQFNVMWNDIFTEMKQMTGLLRSLHREYSLCLLSNTNCLHVEFLKTKYVFFDCIDHECYSYILKSLKPEPYIYKKALEMAGAMPGESLFIDDLRQNVSGARRAGMNAFHFSSYRSLLEDLKTLDICPNV